MSSGHRKQIGSLVAGQYGALLLSFALPMVLARCLSRGELGVYMQFNNISQFAIPVLTCGLASDLYYFLPRTQGAARASAIANALTMLLFASLAGIGLLCLPWVKDYINTEGDFTHIYWFLVAYVALTIPEFLTTTLYVLQRHNRISALYLPGCTLLRVGLILGLYFLWPSVESVLGALVLTALGRFLFSMGYGLRSARREGPVKLNWRQMMEQARYSLPLGLSQGLRQLSASADKLMLLYFITPAEYAVYAMAFYGVPGLMQVYTAVSQSYVAEMVKAAAEKGHEAVIGVYRSMTFKTLGYSIPVLAVVCAAADRLVPLAFSDKYIPSVPYFRIYLLTFVFLCLGAGNMLRAIGKTRMQLYAYGASLAVMLPTTWFCIGRFGLWGAIVCASLSLIVPICILSTMDARIMGCRLSQLFPWKTIGRQVLASACGAGLVLAISPLLGANWQVLPLAAAGGLLAFALEIRLDAFLIPSSEVKNVVGKIAARIVGKLKRRG